MIEHFLFAYLLSLLHEMCHFLAAKFLSLKIDGVLLRPWGSALKLPPVYSPHKEFLVSVAGPIFHLVLIPFSFGNEFFFFCNMAMLLANILPALPLDGGRMMRSCFLSFLPVKKAYHYSRRSTLFFILSLYGISVFLLFWEGMLPPIILLPLFLSISWMETEEKPLFLMHRLFTWEKKRVGNMYVVSAEKSASLLFSELFLDRENFFFLLSPKGIYGVLSDRTLLEGIGAWGSESSFDKIFANMVEKKREIG